MPYCAFSEGLQLAYALGSLMIIFGALLALWLKSASSSTIIIVFGGAFMGFVISILITPYLAAIFTCAVTVMP